MDFVLWFYGFNFVNTLYVFKRKNNYKLMTYNKCLIMY